eukprot:8856141-Pyramimonas_sp.AAC.1
MQVAIAVRVQEWPCWVAIRVRDRRPRIGGRPPEPIAHLALVQRMCARDQIVGVDKGLRVFGALASPRAMKWRFGTCGAPVSLCVDIGFGFAVSSATR